MNTEQFLELKPGDRLRKRNGGDTMLVVCKKYGHALLATAADIIVNPQEWEYENGRQVEKFSDLRIGLRIRRKHSSADFDIVTKLVLEPGREHAHIARTEMISLPEAEGWMQVISWHGGFSIQDFAGQSLRFRR